MTYECQLRFIIPTTRPEGRPVTGFAAPTAPFSTFVFLGASSALPGTKRTSSSSSSSEKEYKI